MLEPARQNFLQARAQFFDAFVRESRKQHVIELFGLLRDAPP